MGCWHGWHGCGPMYGPPPDWYAEDRYPAGWGDALDRGRRRAWRDWRPAGPDERLAGVESELRARLDALGAEIQRAAAELAELRAARADAGDDQLRSERGGDQ